MPALNFQKRFANAVERGEKRQTIRAHRRDGRPTARVGDRLYLYTGMRTKECRKLGEAVCTVTRRVIITEEEIIVDGVPCQDAIKEDLFAQQDGFENFYEMSEWFRNVHGLPFEGSLIKWAPSPVCTCHRDPQTDELKHWEPTCPQHGAKTSIDANELRI